MSPVIVLTPVEQSLLYGMARGDTLATTTTQLQDATGLTVDQLRKLAMALYRKLGTRTQAGAVFEAIRRGLIPCPCPTCTTGARRVR